MLLLLLAGLVCLTGCEPKSPTAELNTSKEMLAVLSPKLPVGTPIGSAREFMAKEGFELEEMKKAKWKGKGPFEYVLCKRDDGVPPIKRRWEVAVMHDGKNVTMLDVRTALLYP
jgi:hypothetical protein